VYNSILKSNTALRSLTLKIISEVVLIDAGGFSNTSDFQTVHQQIRDGISLIVWPSDNTSFTIYPRSKGDTHPNGVVPIKRAVQQHLAVHGWQLETHVNIGVTKKQPGAIDATKEIGSRYFAFEWETGNISSSHRALNKMAIGISRGVLVGGVLVLPSREFYVHLTDRIGNYEELEPYLDLYRVVKCDYGWLSVMVVEHDRLDPNVPKIPKGTDGMSLKRRGIG
jgi:hypothetical protein